MAALKDAATGIVGDVDDLTDTTPQPGSSDSLSTVFSPASFVSFLWTQFSIVAAGVQLIESGGGRSGIETWGILN